ncbi:MAG: 16S rRNA (cytidine(1402)-2'-O)-methyltransferase [Symbiobacteriaceae bacterium]|nr:16S rRNA (cytidine(1402)-2'-O)-methyltransferase [Symbiobacteriaceae bacterium]
MLTDSQLLSCGTFYLVATPIGNLEDLSLRAIRILGEVDIIAAEDTREAKKLLAHLGLRKPCLSYHEHNRRRQGERIRSELQDGRNVALICDAGMPGISDPGQEMIADLLADNLPVIVIPGACAAVTALVASGLPASRFAFEGFLPGKGKERSRRMQDIAGEERTIIIYEAPHRLFQTLTDIISVMGPHRKAALVRELTKIHEEVYSGTLQDLCNYTAEGVRGECVLVITGAESVSLPAEDPMVAFRCYQNLLAEGRSRQYALKEAARRSGVKRDILYKVILNQREDTGCS